MTIHVTATWTDPTPLCNLRDSGPRHALLYAWTKWERELVWSSSGARAPDELVVKYLGKKFAKKHLATYVDGQFSSGEPAAEKWLEEHDSKRGLQVSYTRRIDPNNDMTRHVMESDGGDLLHDVESMYIMALFQRYQSAFSPVSRFLFNTRGTKAVTFKLNRRIVITSVNPPGRHIPATLDNDSALEVPESNPAGRIAALLCS